MTDTVTVDLSRPLKIKKDGKDQEVNSLTFRAPEVGDMIDAETVQGGNIAKSAAVLALQAGISYPEIRRLSPKDMFACMDATEAKWGNALSAAGDERPS